VSLPAGAARDTLTDPAIVGLELRAHFRTCRICLERGGLVERVCDQGAALFRLQLGLRRPPAPSPTAR
jgi:hypothetical protein